VLALGNFLAGHLAKLAFEEEISSAGTPAEEPDRACFLQLCLSRIAL
jgi:hypothetical protein